MPIKTLLIHPSIHLHIQPLMHPFRNSSSICKTSSLLTISSPFLCWCLKKKILIPFFFNHTSVDPEVIQPSIQTSPFYLCIHSAFCPSALPHLSFLWSIELSVLWSCIYTLIHLPIHSSIHWSTFFLSFHSAHCFSTSIPIHPLNCQSIHPSIPLSIHPSVHPFIHSPVDSPFRPFIHPLTFQWSILMSYLFLSQYEDSSRFDGMPGSKSLPPALHLPPLVGLPHPIPQGPADTDVLPLVLRQGQR